MKKFRIVKHAIGFRTRYIVQERKWFKWNDLVELSAKAHAEQYIKDLKESLWN